MTYFAFVRRTMARRRNKSAASRWHLLQGYYSGRCGAPIIPDVRKIADYIELAVRHEALGMVIAIMIACALVAWVASFWP
jgi:hypothetical protein